MDEQDAEQLTGALQAITIVLTALIATHHAPDLLREAIDGMAHRTKNQSVTYEKTLATLRRAIL